jgi:hypothetical protein
MSSHLPDDDLSRTLTIARADAADARPVAVAGGGPPLHRHDFEEAFVVLDGEIERRSRAQPLAAQYRTELFGP